MKIDNQLTDDVVLAELGQRLQGQRIRAGRTQAELAKQSGIAKRTLERMEAGEIAQLSSVVRVLRALDQLQQLDALLPPVAPSPMDLLKRKGQRRQRASSKRRSTEVDNSMSKSKPNWNWGDDA